MLSPLSPCPSVLCLTQRGLFFSGPAAPFLVVPGLLTCGTGPFVLNQSRAAARANRIQSFSKYNINNLFSPQLLHVTSIWLGQTMSSAIANIERGHLASAANVLICPLSVFCPEGLGHKVLVIFAGVT